MVCCNGQCIFIYQFSQRFPTILEQFLYDVLAMVKQLGIPTYILTLSCADLLIWEELPYIINKLNNLGLSDGELKIVSY